MSQLAERIRRLEIWAWGDGDVPERLPALEELGDSQWRDISTAPKDGTEIVLYGVWAGEIHGENDAPSIDIGRWGDGCSDFPGNDWWALSTGDAYACWMRATHWMPLPPAPGAKQ